MTISSALEERDRSQSQKRDAGSEADGECRTPQERPEPQNQPVFSGGHPRPHERQIRAVEPVLDTVHGGTPTRMPHFAYHEKTLRGTLRLYFEKTVRRCHDLGSLG